MNVRPCLLFAASCAMAMIVCTFIAAADLSPEDDKLLADFVAAAPEKESADYLVELARKNVGEAGVIVFGVIETPEYPEPRDVLTFAEVAAGGRFAFACDRRKTAQFRLQGYAPLDVPLADKTAGKRVFDLGVLRLEKLRAENAATIKGRILVAGKPVANSRIDVKPEVSDGKTGTRNFYGQPLRFYQGKPKMASALSDAEGCFELGGLTPGNTLFSISGEHQGTFRMSTLEAGKVADLGDIRVDPLEAAEVAYKATFVRSSTLTFKATQIVRTAGKVTSKGGEIMIEDDSVASGQPLFLLEFRRGVIHALPVDGNTFVDLGKGDISKFLTVKSEPLLTEQFMAPRVRIVPGNTYLSSSSRGSKWVLLQLEYDYRPPPQLDNKPVSIFSRTPADDILIDATDASALFRSVKKGTEKWSRRESLNSPELQAYIDERIKLANSTKPASAARVFTDQTGAFRVNATLVRVSNGVAHLKRQDDGRVVAIPLAKLSESDRAWIASQPAE